MRVRSLDLTTTEENLKTTILKHKRNQGEMTSDTADERYYVKKGLFSVRPGGVRSFYISLSTSLNVDTAKLDNPEPTKIPKNTQNSLSDSSQLSNTLQRKQSLLGNKRDDNLLDLTSSSDGVQHETENRNDLLKIIEQDEKLLKLLENRVRRAKNNLDELNEEFKLIASHNDNEAKEDTVEQIRGAETALNEATEQLMERMKHLRETQQKLDLINFKMHALGFQSTNDINRMRLFSASQDLQMREWEATLHGIVTGAGGMLVSILLYNLMCVKLDRLTRVPIKWVGFNDSSEAELPLHKAN